MFNHRPVDYTCPFCAFVAGHESDENAKQDIVYQDSLVTAFVAPEWWPNNAGSVMIIPNKHFENIYDISATYLDAVSKVVRQVAIAIRTTYGCAGISIVQHNEPAGEQYVWHLHVHVLPHYAKDGFDDSGDKIPASEAIRAPYAKKLRAHFSKSQ